ncbi:DUF1642 domain-containing protein [Streptococcus uberis]|uniref:DUF1642 domain-containing protein n=1 Tax=Streptococcus uberis TaxID=1349 RepID=UPI0012B612AE|nr:DUF1642 domain-containing protein [Streptococcus uberis]MTB42129.1 DUF1642 domain-containing protein [Streptococcus uberis]
MKIEGLKKGQAVWVKGFVDRSVFGGCGGFIDFYNQDGNHCGHISRNNVREMKEEDVQIDQPKEVYKWLNCRNKRQADINALALVTLIVNGPDAVTVEKEKLYNVNVLGCTLFKMTSDNHVRYKLIGKNETPPESKFDSYEFEANLTEKEIKQADERLWQFAKSAF